MVTNDSGIVMGEKEKMEKKQKLVWEEILRTDCYWWCLPRSMVRM